MSPSVLWDAAKAVLRGKLMWSSKKKKQKQLADLTNKLKALEQKHTELNDPNLLQQTNVLIKQDP